VDGVVGPQTWTALFVTVKRGDRGEAVSAVQHRLAWEGFFEGDLDGVFGDRTEAAVRQFQNERGIAEDGAIGPKTWAALVATG
jgi:peptidoglycan hydrolase-like protein with peptidoglycan-binding domain